MTIPHIKIIGKIKGKTIGEIIGKRIGSYFSVIPSIILENIIGITEK
jgi:hypothetical protein